MPKLAKNNLPAYRCHKASGQAVVTLSGRDHYLGPHGSEISKAEYDRVVSEWMTNGRTLPAPRNHREPTLTITELIAAYWNHAKAYYVKDEKPTSEQGLVRLAMRPLRRLYGRTLVSDFGPLALKTVRESMIKHGACRATINGYVDRIKRMFRWATENELVTPEVYHGLRAVSGLRRDRSEARESEPVRPVPQEFVDAIRPHLSRQVGAMVRLQELTGMRPGEVIAMRTADIDTTGPVWHYKPQSHKTQHHGHGRVIELGPRAQAVIRPFLRPDLEAYLFSAAEAESERRAEQRRRRKTRVQPSQRNRRKKNPKRRPHDRYGVAEFRRAVARACDQADREAKKARNLPLDGERLVPRWHPNQLRHNFASRIRREHGLEIARILLGHRTMAVTEIYAEVDRRRTADIVARSG